MASSITQKYKFKDSHSSLVKELHKLRNGNDIHFPPSNDIALGEQNRLLNASITCHVEVAQSDVYPT